MIEPRRQACPFRAMMCVALWCGIPFGGLASAQDHASARIEIVPTRDNDTKPDRTIQRDNPCSFHCEIKIPGQELIKTKEAMLSSASGEVFMVIELGESKPDPDLLMASHSTESMRVGDLFIDARRQSRTDFRLEEAGDSRPTYMREAALLKVGDTWFVGDRAGFRSNPAGRMDISVDVDFVDLYEKTRNFEIWLKGQRKMLVNAVPDRTSPAEFSEKCLKAPAFLRTERKGSSKRVYHKLDASTVPRLLDFVGNYDGAPTPFNPFQTEDSSPGSAEFRITVGRDGLVKQCNLIKQTGKVPQRPEACRSLREDARFLPAVGADGAPREAEMQVGFDWGSSTIG